MNSKLNVDIPKSKTKQAKAMVYRSYQGLRKELKSIDQQYLKTLSHIDRDLEKTKETLKALKVSQKHARRKTDPGRTTRQPVDFGDSLPAAAWRRRSRSRSVPFENELGFLGQVEARRTSELVARAQVRAVRKAGKTAAEVREKQTDEKIDEVSEHSEQENNVILVEGKGNETIDKAEEIATFASHATQVKGELGTRLVEGERGLETTVADWIQQNLGENAVEDHGGLETNDLTRVVEVQGTRCRGDLGTSVEENRKDLGASVDEAQGGLSTNMNDGKPGKETGEECEPGAKQILKNTWTEYEDDEKDGAEMSSLPNRAKISLGSQRRKILTRRASTPNMTFTSPPAAATELGITNKPRPERSGLSMTTILQLNQGNIALPPEKPAPRPRRSSIAVMTGVTPPFIPGSSPPSSLLGNLPELMENSRTNFNGSSLGGGVAFDKRRSSVQENQMQEYLRKISKRLTTPLTGAQLEKRLQAHRVNTSSAALPARQTCMPETGKQARQLDMSELEDCRYIRRRVSK